MSGLMSLTGAPDTEPFRSGISVFDVMAGLHATIGILAALHARDETGRGQHVEVNLLSSALSGHGQPDQRLRRGRRRPAPDGQQPPEPVPLRADAECADGELIITAGNNGQFRKLARCSASPSSPTTRASRATRTAPRTATSSGRCWSSGSGPGRRWTGSATIIAAGVPCGPINTVDGGVGFATEIGLDPVVEVGEGAAMVPSVRNPITFSETPADYRLPPPEARRARRRDPGVAVEAETCMSEPASSRRRWGRRRADEIRLLGQDLTEDLMGKVGFGELAFWLVTLRRPTPQETRVFEAVLVALADHGFTPTAIAARLTYLSAPDSLQGALAAGLLGGGSRFLGVTEDCGQFLHAVLEADRRPAHRRRRVGRARPRRRTPGRARPGAFVPGLGHPVHKVQDPRTPRLIAIAEEEGLRGPHLRLFEAIGRTHEQVLGRTASAQRRGCLRRRARRPRPAGRPAARLRAARPRRRPARPDRRGGATSDRDGRLSHRRPQRGLRRPRRPLD